MTNPTDRFEASRDYLRPREGQCVIQHPLGGLRVVTRKEYFTTPTERQIGSLPPLYPEWLGDRAFCETYGVRFPYAAGSMANGIATPALVVAMARAGLLAFFGAGGLSFNRVSQGLDEIARELAGQPTSWGANLIHSPQEPVLEERVAGLFIARGVPVIEASAFMGLTPALVRVACAGLRVDAKGRIERHRRVLGKVSRLEVARALLAPPPRDLLQGLVERAWLTPSEAQLAALVPLTEDLTVEADSGGHTDNRPLVAMLPAFLALRDELESTLGAVGTIRVGAAGGIGTPAAAAAAFAMGAAYVMTGSVNQSAVESGLSPSGKQLLARAEMTDITMAPAADMFELGVKLQVLKRGTLFASRAQKLYDAWRGYPSLEALPGALQDELERRVFGTPLDTVWRETEAFWLARDPSQLELASTDPKHKMALAFRWYLGRTSRWAITGDPTRTTDYQIWCGPAMGAFNVWVRGSFLEPLPERTVVQIALNILEGAAALTRAHQLRTFGVPVPAAAFDFRPRRLQI